MKLLARMFFCGVPAVVVGLIACLLHPAVGVVMGGASFGLGWDVTREPK